MTELERNFKIEYRNGMKTVMSIADDVRPVGYFEIPDGVECIFDGAFFKDLALTAIILPEGLKEIQMRAFQRCDGLEMIYIPASVEIIGSDAFDGCKKLRIYCGGQQSKSGWVNKVEIRKESYTTDEDYAFDFHRGGVSRWDTEVEYKIKWNPSDCPVEYGVSREKFLEIFKRRFLNG